MSDTPYEGVCVTTPKQVKIISEIIQKLSELDYASISFHNSLVIDEVQEKLRQLCIVMKDEKNDEKTPPPQVVVPIKKDIPKNNINFEPVSTFKVLVVDDDEDITRLLRFALKPINVEVVSYNDPTKALSEIEVTNPQLILLDVLMPQMTGFEFLEALKTRQIDHCYKVIVVSGKHSQADRILALEKGALDYIEKPYDLQELKLKIERLRNEQKSAENKTGKKNVA